MSDPAEKKRNHFSVPHYYSPFMPRCQAIRRPPGQNRSLIYFSMRIAALPRSAMLVAYEQRTCILPASPKASPGTTATFSARSSPLANSSPVTPRFSVDGKPGRHGRGICQRAAAGGKGGGRTGRRLRRSGQDARALFVRDEHGRPRQGGDAHRKIYQRAVLTGRAANGLTSRHKRAIIMRYGKVIPLFFGGITHFTEERARPSAEQGRKSGEGDIDHGGRIYHDPKRV